MVLIEGASKSPGKLKTQIAVPILLVSDSVDLRKGPIICLFYKFPGIIKGLSTFFCLTAYSFSGFLLSLPLLATSR